MEAKTVIIGGEALIIEYRETKIGDTVVDLNSNTKYEASISDADDLNWIATGKGEAQNAKIEVLIPLEKIFGNQSGNNLYLVTFIEHDEPEDTFTEMWRASNEDDLYEQVKDDRSEDADDQIQFEESFEEDWGTDILFELIGEVK
jgi:hypothetical protein